MNTTHAPRERCQISTVNFHLWKPCNMRCRYCFAHFHDAGHANFSRDEALAVVRELSRGFERITFVGGEPTLCPWLLDLVDAPAHAGARQRARVTGLGQSESRAADRIPPLPQPR